MHRKAKRLQREVATERCPGNRIGKGITRFLTKSRLENDSRSDQIREVPLTLTHRYSCPGIFNSNRWSTKDILAKEQEAELDVIMIPLLKKISLSPEEGHIMRHKLVK